MTETLLEDHQELAFEFVFSIDPVNFIGDSFQIKSNNKNYGKLDIRRETGDQIGTVFVVILFCFLMLVGFFISPVSNFRANSPLSNPHLIGLIILILSAIMLISSFVIFFNPFLRFLPVRTKVFAGNQTLLFRSHFGIHKFSSLVRRNYWIFKDHKYHNSYSLYFSHNKGFLQINKSKFVLDMKQYNDSTLELTNKSYNFTVKLNKNNLSKKIGNFVISTPSQVDDNAVLFIGFVLYTTGQLNSLLEEIAFQSIRIVPVKNKVILGLISAVLNSLVFPSIIVFLALAFFPSLLHSNSQWGTFFMIIDLILFAILWFFLIKSLLVNPIKHFRKNIWTEGDNQTYFVSELFAVMIIAMILTLLFMIVSNPQFHSLAFVFLTMH